MIIVENQSIEDVKKIKAKVAKIKNETHELVSSNCKQIINLKLIKID